MCQVSIAWNGVPWWAKAALAMQGISIACSLLFWAVAIVSVYVMDEPVPRVLESVATAMFAPLFKMQEIGLQAQREWHQTKLLTQAHQTCQALMMDRDDPEVVALCREALFKTFTNTTHASTKDYEYAETGL